MKTDFPATSRASGGPTSLLPLSLSVCCHQKSISLLFSLLFSAKKTRKAYHHGNSSRRSCWGWWRAGIPPEGTAMGGPDPSRKAVRAGHIGHHAYVIPVHRRTFVSGVLSTMLSFPPSLPPTQLRATPVPPCGNEQLKGDDVFVDDYTKKDCFYYGPCALYCAQEQAKSSFFCRCQEACSLCTVAVLLQRWIKFLVIP